MRHRLAPLLPVALALLLGACATAPTAPTVDAPQVAATGPTTRPIVRPAPEVSEDPSKEAVAHLVNGHAYALPPLADNIIDLGYKLVGTPYRYGGGSVKTGFDCSGFVGFLFRKEAGIELPRSTREMIQVDAPVVARQDLEPGDIIFFNNRGRGRVSHAGIYIGDDQFIHSASRRSGGVRIDSLDDKYWRASFMEAKRVLAQVSVSH